METIWRCSVILHANTGRVLFISFFGVPAFGNTETISNVTFGKRLKTRVQQIWVIQLYPRSLKKPSGRGGVNAGLYGVFLILSLLLKAISKQSQSLLKQLDLASRGNEPRYKREADKTELRESHRSGLDEDKTGCSLTPPPPPPPPTSSLSSQTPPQLLLQTSVSLPLFRNHAAKAVLGGGETIAWRREAWKEEALDDLH